MSRPVPRALRVPLGVVAARDGLAAHVARLLSPRPADLARVVHAFAFKNDERTFARLLLSRHTQLWVYRTHQAVACGDFVVVDRSSPLPRRVWVVELKRARPVRVGGGWQLRHAETVVADLVRAGELAADSGCTRLTGDSEAVLIWFAAARPPTGGGPSASPW